MQSHKNCVNRLILIDRVLQRNTYDRPEGATRESIEASVRNLLSSEESQFLTPAPFNDLWRGKDAFRKDLKFILTHYPGIMQKKGNKLWSYRGRGMSIFPRFGNTLDDKIIQEAILLLEYQSNHPLSQLYQIGDVIHILKEWFAISSANPKQNQQPVFQHQFSTEDEDIFTKETTIILHNCCQNYGRRIVNLSYYSTRTGEKRILEFHPWRFIESEHRWYVIGFISHDLVGNYPKELRSNYPGLALRLDAVASVQIIPYHELEARKNNRKFIDDRHLYRSEKSASSILSMTKRIGTGGWESKFSNELKATTFLLKFRVHQNAVPYFESCELHKYVNADLETNTQHWNGYIIQIGQHTQGKGLTLINRETIGLLRSFGPLLEVIQPKELREMLQIEFRAAHNLYNK